MTISNLIAVIGIFASVCVALVVAYMHRRQMRQIELYKQDPSAGLIPPPHRLTKFIASKWDTILGFAGPIYVLVTQALSDQPVTRLTIFVISGAFALMFTNFVMALVFKLQQRNTERITQVLQLHELALEGQGRIVGILEKMRT